MKLTSTAQTQVKDLIEKERTEQNPPEGLGLRLAVRGGGCSGFSYALGFDIKRDGDITAPQNGFDVYLDKKSTIYLRGTEVDYTDGLEGKGFVFKNPNASNSCGCGESFSV